MNIPPLTITITISANTPHDLSMRAEHNMSSDNTELQRLYAHGLMALIKGFAEEVGERAEASGTGHFGLAVGGKDLNPLAAEAQVRMKQTKGNN